MPSSSAGLLVEERERVGARPRLSVVPEAVANSAPEVIELAASAGLELDDWQQFVLHGSLGERADGAWAASTVAVKVPRQNGKNGILEARQLGGLFLFGEHLQTHTAHRFDACLEHFGRIRELIEGTPDLDRRVVKILDSNGKESIEVRDFKDRRCRLIFKARAKGSGRAFSGRAVYFDEAMWLKDLGSMVPSLSAQRHRQLWFVGSAPLPIPESNIWRGIVRRGRELAAP